MIRARLKALTLASGLLLATGCWSSAGSTASTGFFSRWRCHGKDNQPMTAAVMPYGSAMAGDCGCTGGLAPGYPTSMEGPIMAGPEMGMPAPPGHVPQMNVMPTPVPNPPQGTNPPRVIPVPQAQPMSIMEAPPVRSPF